MFRMESNKMKVVKLTVSLVAMVLFSSNALSGVYKCTNDQGQTAYQSAPCAEDNSAIKIDMKTGGTTDLAAKLKQQENENELLKQQEIEKQNQLAKETKRQQNAIEQSEINQQLIKDNTVQYTAFAIPPYEHDKLPALVKVFEARLPEIEKFRRLAAQKALATGECKRVESSQLSVKSQTDQLVFSIDCSSARTFHFTESELVKK